MCWVIPLSILSSSENGPVDKRLSHRIFIPAFGEFEPPQGHQYSLTQDCIYTTPEWYHKRGTIPFLLYHYFISIIYKNEIHIIIVKKVIEILLYLWRD